MSPVDARALLEEEEPGTVQVVDVRSEGEYEKGHLPGALHLPVDQLDERMQELDSDKTTLLY